MTEKNKSSKSGKKKKWSMKSIDKSPYIKIPAFNSKIKEIRKFLVSNSNLKLILIDASKINKIEQEYGKKIYGKILGSLGNIIAEMKGNQIRNEDIITVSHVNSDKFYIFLSKYRKNNEFHNLSLADVADRIRKYINTKMFNSVYALLKRRPRINVGYSIVIYNPLIQEERLMDNLIDDAKTMAKYNEFKTMLRNKEKLQELIIKEKITTIYQPIVNLQDHEIIGYEALSRGPKMTEYENPIVLFNIAEETDLLFELDSICRRKAFLNAKGIKKNIKLFVNIIPNTIHDPEFTGEYLKNFLEDIKISPHRVVLEVSERQIIENYDIFKNATEYYSDLGFAIAIDDTGTGYSTLQSLLQLNLQYLKIDISLVSGIDKDPLKQELVKALIRISQSIGAKLVAEGIETVGEMKMLTELGIDYGQGFLFAKPALPFVGVNIIEK